MNGVPPEKQPLRPEVLRTLGAVLYRAGHTQEAIDRLNEAIAASKGRSVAQDWLLLALAHHRLGHAAEATRALEKARTLQPKAEAQDIWDNLEIELLRCEAETVITGKAAGPGGLERPRRQFSKKVTHSCLKTAAARR